MNCGASLALALAVFLRRSRTEASVLFGWFALTVAFWSMGYFFWQIAQNTESALFWSRILTAAAIVVPVAYYHCVLSLIGRRQRLGLAVGYVGALVFSILAFTSQLVKGVEAKADFPFWPVPGKFYPCYLLFFFYFVIVTVFRLVRGLQESEGLERNQLRLVLLGTSIGFLGGSTNYFLWYNVPIPPVGNGLVTVYVGAVGYAIIRFRLMEVNLLAARWATYAVLVALLSMLTPIAVAAIERLPIAVQYDISLVPVFFASFLATTASFAVIPALRRRVDSFLEQRVLGSRLPDRALLRGLVTKINSAVDETSMLRKVVTSLSTALDVKEVAVYTRTEFEAIFLLRASSGRLPEDAGEFPDKAILILSLQRAERSLVLDETVHALTDERRDYFIGLRRKQRIEIAVPIIGDTLFYGFITLGIRADHALYNEVDVSLLDAIGLQIGLNLRARQLERRASQTEKLISLGTLAAGLAHELRNPLVSIQTFSALLKERGTDLDFQQEFSAIVQRDVNRIASIVENVAAFAESNRVQMTEVDLSQVLTAAAEIARPEMQHSQVELVISMDRAPRVTANYSQLLQVFLNLIQNAVQAMDGRPVNRMVVDFELQPGAPQAMLCVILTDNGPGIEPSILPHIFDPFTTTKATGQRLGKHGMGLGLAIVKRIIQHHHGEIRVSSVPGQGTTFRVYLPAIV